MHVGRGLNVKVDLIIGLPGDTVASVRRGFEYLAQSELFTTVQVFNLAILPGTAFRQKRPCWVWSSRIASVLCLGDADHEDSRLLWIDGGS